MTLYTRCGRRAFDVATDYSLPVQIYCAPGSGLPGDDTVARFLTLTVAEARQLLADGVAVHPEDISVTWERCDAGSMEDAEDCDAPATVPAFYVGTGERGTFSASAAPSPAMVQRLRLCCACACHAEEYPDAWLRIGADSARDWGCA